MADLYGVDLNPDGTAAATPAGGFPDGSLGGSDVGANEQDDQRVRDLITQEIYDIKQEINNLLLNPASTSNGWVPLKFVHYPNWLVVWQDAVVNPTEIDLESYTVTFTGKPLMFEVSVGEMIVNLDANGSSPETFSMSFRLFVDGSFATETNIEIPLATPGSQHSEVRQWADRFIFIPGRSAAWISTSEATSFFGEGEHTIQMDWKASHTNWEGVDIDVEVRRFTMAWYELSDDSILTYDEDASSFDGT